MRIIEEEQLEFSDLLISPQCSNILSRKDVNLHRTIKWKSQDGKENSITFIPYGTSNMGTIGTVEFAKKMALSEHIASIEKHVSTEEIDGLYEYLTEYAIKENKEKTFYTDKLIVSIGIRESLDGLRKLYDKWHIRMIMIDSPNGYIPSLYKRIDEVRDIAKDSFLIAGNVVDSSGAALLVMHSVNCTKIGIGNGSCCRTRVKSHVGRPQASAIIDVANYVHQQKLYCMCDGGVNNAGEVACALGCGADMVISGSLFAATEEADGETIEIDGKKFKQYYGMSSHLAQEKHFGGIRKYSASEGMEKMIPVTGTLESVLSDIDGGIRSTATYIGCDNMKDFSQHTTFYKVRKQFNDIFEGCKNIR